MVATDPGDACYWSQQIAKRDLICRVTICREVRSMKAIVLCCACAAVASSLTMAAGTQVAEVPPAVQYVAARTITRETLEGPIRFLASDLLEGRGPATRGDQLARLYLATELEAMGYQPAGPDGKWE